MLLSEHHLRQGLSAIFYVSRVKEGVGAGGELPARPIGKRLPVFAPQEEFVKVVLAIGGRVEPSPTAPVQQSGADDILPRILQVPSVSRLVYINL